MINENFIYVGALVSFLGTLSYLVATIKGEAKPNRVTFFIWGIAPLIAFSASVKQGVGLQSLLTFMSGLNPLLIFFASFINKKAYWKLSKRDFVCGGLAIFGLMLWQITSIPNLAILFSILADGFASFPTLIKAYHYPETENAIGYLGPAIAAFITLLTITTWQFAYYAFPLYLFLVCTTLFVFIRFKVGKRKS